MRLKGLDASRAAVLVALAVVGAALVVKLVLMIYIGDRAYGDVLRAVRFGRDVAAGTISIHTHVDNSKTFVGPVLWYRIYDGLGLWGLRAFNAIAFTALALSQWVLGRRSFGAAPTLVAVFLLAFYPGTHRNVAAGELDDNLAALLLAVSILVLLRTRSRVAPGLILGVAFLFKFWIAIFIAGLVLHLTTERRWRAAVWTLTAGAAPFLALDLGFAGAGSKALLFSLEKQAALSGWSLIGTRLVTTALLPFFLVAGWAVLRRNDATRRLFFLVPAPYLVYVVVMRDAHAVTFVMTACLITWSYLIAEVLLEEVPGRALPVLLGAYLLVGVAIGAQHLRRDTHPFELGDEISAPRVAYGVGSAAAFDIITAPAPAGARRPGVADPHPS